ncbi:MAG: thermonuclease family protein [Rubrivivax sp.]|jgi:endonuclease YncB( thermonuclease family)|nr:thermonuclease family protein [Rubrivivax sp.]
MAGARASVVALGVVLLLPGASSAQGARVIEGTVTRVVDGDSLWVAPASGPPVEVRLHGIDAPEGCQAGGPEARRALEDLVLRRPVSVRSRGRDDHGRLLGVVSVDGIDVNVRQVEEGWAWSSRYKWDRGPYVKQERMAQALRRGIFALPGAEEPREFRRRHGPCRSGDVPPAMPPSPRDLPAAAPAAASPMRCDGRTQCSQMRSCEEATWFLRHCPGTAMDGDGDGIPCESQWCGAR